VWNRASAVLTLVAVTRVYTIFLFDLLMGNGELVAETEDSLSRIQAIGPDA